MFSSLRAYLRGEHIRVDSRREALREISIVLLPIALGALVTTTLWLTSLPDNDAPVRLGAVMSALVAAATERRLAAKKRGR